jgi:hypothetical protein
MSKAVPKVDLNGLYIEDEIQDDSITGVVPFYAQPVREEAPEHPEDVDTEEPEEDTEPAPEPEREIIGYLVGIPVIPGLYHPRFDLIAWEAFQDAVAESQSDYADELHDWREQWAEGEEQGTEPVYVPPAQPDNLWVEGLTPEEIAELNKPGEPSEMELLKAKNAALEKLIEDRDRENKNALFEIYAMLLGGE